MYPQGLRCEQHLQAIILLWQKFKNIVIAVYIIGLNSSSFSVVIPFVIVFGIPPIKAEYISTSFDFGPGNKDNFVHYKEAEMMQEWVLRNFECFHLPSCTSTIIMKRASLSGPLVQGRWQKHAKQPTQMSPDKMSWFPTDRSVSSCFVHWGVGVSLFNTSYTSSTPHPSRIQGLYLSFLPTVAPEQCPELCLTHSRQIAFVKCMNNLKNHYTVRKLGPLTPNMCCKIFFHY